MEFEWIDFYMEFAGKLLPYKDDRQTLIEKIKAVYAAIEMKLPTLDSDGEVVDIDPFTVFGLFNKGITDANRSSVLGGIAKEFGVAAKVPHDFAGIPVLMLMKATFYEFIKDGRKEDDINNIWELFAAALVLSEEDNEVNRINFSKWYDVVSKQSNTKWKITMGLYWVRPYCFINLDRPNREYLMSAEELPTDFKEEAKQKLKKLPAAAEYLSLRDKCREILDRGEYEYKNFPELSHHVWIAKQGNSKAAFLRWFKPLLQALRDLGGSAKVVEVRQKIIENEHLSDDELNATIGKNKVNKFESEVAFARLYLVESGYIDRSIHGVWTLTEAGKTVEMTEALAAIIFKRVVAKGKGEPENTRTALPDKNVDTVRYWLYAPGE